MTSARNNISIYFNDTLIATTSSIISYERESEDQKKYRFFNTESNLSATLFCNDLIIIQNDNIKVEVL